MKGIIMEFKIDKTKLKIAMLQHGILTIDELAAKLGCTRQNFYQTYIKDSALQKNIPKLCEVLGVPPEDILK
ncbi:MAG TPA: helix-turn-helix transcriptional regulator [Candidatus Marinimicrobia bacterium]|nr:helix-turn-helix transcriptional regulator [Candidatus Neomarinimicrobiota bacterium]HQK11521.1 helix-turn-helix transcriptional regulator [Candidatus Neomarinimicrobiota bacterium]